MNRLINGILLLDLIAGVAGCDDNNPVTTPTTTTGSTTTPTTTETFSGTLNRNGGVTYPFTAGAGGTITLTLTSVGPDASQAIGMSLGTWTGTACQTVIPSDAATQGTVVTGTVSAAAALCARVYDAAGSIPVAQPVSFTVTIAHP